jgi:hypothetical protein
MSLARASPNPASSATSAANRRARVNSARSGAGTIDRTAGVVARSDMGASDDDFREVLEDAETRIHRESHDLEHPAEVAVGSDHPEPGFGAEAAHGL